MSHQTKMLMYNGMATGNNYDYEILKNLFVCKCDNARSRRNTLIVLLTTLFCSSFFIIGIVLTAIYRDYQNVDDSYVFFAGLSFIVLAVLSLFISFCICCCLRQRDENTQVYLSD